MCLLRLRRLGECDMDGTSQLDAYIAEIKRRGFRGEIMVKQACETIRTSYYESTIRCVNHTEGCAATLIVCGENLLDQRSNHADCAEACGWRWILSEDTYGAMCPDCAEGGSNG